LPAPVARYLRWAMPQDLELDAVRLVQTGSLRTDAQSDRWMPFSATHLVVPRATGFVWIARVAVAPAIHVGVRDAFVEGTGSGQVSVMSAFTVSADGGTPEMNSGSLHRYLAEAVWYPTALLPSDKLRWSGVDANRAIATLSDHGVSVALEFRFGHGGEVTGIYTPGRWGSFDGGYRQVAWEGHFREYEMHYGMIVPMEGEVGWYADDVWQPVWRGRITAFIAEVRK
jgi:hypothetical protein